MVRQKSHSVVIWVLILGLGYLWGAHIPHSSQVERNIVQKKLEAIRLKATLSSKKTINRESKSIDWKCLKNILNSQSSNTKLTAIKLNEDTLSLKGVVRTPRDFYLLREVYKKNIHIRKTGFDHKNAITLYHLQGRCLKGAL